MIETLKIGTLQIAFHSKEKLGISSELTHFISKYNAQSPSIDINIYKTEAFPVIKGQNIQSIDARTTVMKSIDNQCEYRIFFNPISGVPYVLYKEISSDCANVFIIKEYFPQFQISTAFLEFIALEKHLLRYNSLILHSSSIILGGKAVLFSAPSGTGKSTQAQLWNTETGCMIQNGDRNILHKNDQGVWEVQGIPFCGTSGINNTTTFPLRAIVTLAQASYDEVTELTHLEKFKKIYSEITVNTWNEKYVNKAVTLCEDLIKNTDICLLQCTPNVTAVKCLENYLGR